MAARLRWGARDGCSSPLGSAGALEMAARIRSAWLENTAPADQDFKRFLRISIGFQWFFMVSHTDLPMATKPTATLLQFNCTCIAKMGNNRRKKVRGAYADRFHTFPQQQKTKGTKTKTRHTFMTGDFWKRHLAVFNHLDCTQNDLW